MLQLQTGHNLTTEYDLFPFEIYIIGTPVSLQAKSHSKERWKNDIKKVAKERIEETVELAWLEPEPLSATIYYFPIAEMAGDIDNIVKPIMDALIKVIYLDDKSVEAVTVQKFEPQATWGFSEPSEQLSAAIDATVDQDKLNPVVYIKILNDLSWRNL